MGIQLRKMLQTRVIVVFGATSRLGKSTIETLANQSGITIIAGVENAKDNAARRIKHIGSNCFVMKCDFSQLASIQRVVRNADAVLLVPALSIKGARFARHVIEAVANEEVPRLVIIRSILASTDFWGRPPAPAAAEQSQEQEDMETFARDRLGHNCVMLRIPLLMETIMYCHDEIIYANHMTGSFAPSTSVPCIAVQDVAIAASEVLSQGGRKYEPSYCLASKTSTVTPETVANMLSESLKKPVKYRQVSDEQVLLLLREKGTPEHVAKNLVQLKYALAQATEPAHESDNESKPSVLPPVSSPPRPPPFRFTNDFRQLTKQDMMSPQSWLEANVDHFKRKSQMQLFVLGAGDALFMAMETFMAHQAMSPTAELDPNADEPPVPSGTGMAQQSKVTFCTLKSEPAGRHQKVVHYYQVKDEPVSPVHDLVKQLTQLDVVVFVIPLRLEAETCVDMLKTIIEAAKKAAAWGIVLVSSIYAHLAWDDSVHRLSEMERLLSDSGVSYVIVRFPLFMEYFLALGADVPTSPARSSAASASVAVAASAPSAKEEEEEKPTPPVHPSIQEQLELEEKRSAAQVPAAPAAPTKWHLMDRSLATTPLYLMAMTDAVKALAAIAYTFPVHRNRTRTLYTEKLTMSEVEQVLQSQARKGVRIDLSRIDALTEARQHEFWRVAYWPVEQTKQFLETAVEISAGSPETEEPCDDYELMTDCEPTRLADWAKLHAREYSALLAANRTS